jgi:hypothetical protein
MKTPKKAQTIGHVRARRLINEAFDEWKRWSGRLDADEGEAERREIDGFREEVFSYIDQLRSTDGA